MLLPAVNNCSHGMPILAWRGSEHAPRRFHAEQLSRYIHCSQLERHMGHTSTVSHNDRAASRISGVKAKKLIRVYLGRQVVEAYEGEMLVFRFSCVSGDKDHPTDRGTFRIMRMHKTYTSNKYKVRMDYAMFFTHDGKAIHQYHGPVPWALLRTGRALTERVGSHGCVRLTEADAERLFKWALVGTEVHVA